MLKRSITAVLLVTFILTMVFWVRRYWIGAADLTIALFGFVGTYEMFHSLNNARDDEGNKRYNMMIAPVIIGVILIAPLSILFAMDGLMVSVLIPTLVALVMMTFGKEKYGLKDLFATVFTLIYPLSIMSLFFIMNHGRGDVLPLILVTLIAVLEDTMAYLVGVTFKGPKLCPTISPKKTISGAIGGVIGGMMGAVIVFLMFDYGNLFEGVPNVGVLRLHPNMWVALAIYLVVGLIGGVVGELGDLAASSIKRKLGIKDYGKIFPGHGGFMDRIDSFVFVLPVVYIMAVILFPESNTILHLFR